MQIGTLSQTVSGLPLLQAYHLVSLPEIQVLGTVEVNGKRGGTMNKYEVHKLISVQVFTQEILTEIIYHHDEPIMVVNHNIVPVIITTYIWTVLTKFHGYSLS